MKSYIREIRTMIDINKEEKTKSVIKGLDEIFNEYKKKFKRLEDRIQKLQLLLVDTTNKYAETTKGINLDPDGEQLLIKYGESSPELSTKMRGIFESLQWDFNRRNGLSKRSPQQKKQRRENGTTWRIMTYIFESIERITLHNLQ